MKILLKAVVTALLLAWLPATPTLAHVGDVLNKDMSQGLDPAHAEHAFIKYLRFYVPGQSASGAADPDIEYLDADGVTVLKTRTGAKPLISVFIHGPVIHPPAAGDENAGGFVGHGRREAYGAVSLDDGNTWKTVNLSESADKSSVTVSVPLMDPTDGSSAITDYPGDVVNVVHATAGNKVLVAWPSRYCSTGSPGYTLANAVDTTERDAVAAYIGTDPTIDLYLADMFGVAGSQGTIDYTALGYPTIGEVPYNCLWTARGALLAGDDPRTAETEEHHMVWFKPERLTSGRRDVNRVEVQMVAGAGATVSWQEDPSGLLPGSGEGPGEGWSGAIGGNQTDTWYSFLPWEYFDIVSDADGNPIPLGDDPLTDEVEVGYWPDTTTQPQVYVPFAVPMRVTNNARCNTDAEDDPYCVGELSAAYGLKDQCADIAVNIPQGESDLGDICVSEDGVPNVANTAATRARMSLQARDSDGDGLTDSAWVIIVNEESKGMGRFLFQVGETDVATATTCLVEDETCEIADIGKNIWYHSFDMGSPNTSADLSATGLVRNLVAQGNLLNQPEVDWRTGEIMPPMDTADMWNFTSATGTDYNFEIYRTEIARRSSLLVQPLANQGGSGLLALLTYKQGLLNQGGPADIMARRLIDAGQTDNPYDFANIVCAESRFNDGSNPYYPKGICLSPALNLSAVTPQDCVEGGSADGVDGSDGICPTIDTAGIASDDPEDQQLFDKLTEWVQCPGSPLCGTNDLSTALGSNLDDQSWYMPLDVAKGHRGYLWRDLVVAMYAWSPNWKLNAKGADRYELYIRRSFDGGVSWTTTPATWGGAGTTTCETMRDGESASEQSVVCTAYAAGADEQARNVSQLKSAEATSTNKFTVLDPRYAPSPPTMSDIEDATYADPDSDVFNPSRFFVVYETGDNTTTAEGEAESLDLFFGRAVNFGDHYQTVSEETAMEATCLPGTTTDAGIFCNEFQRLNTGLSEAEEASLAMSPSGDLMYAAWAQIDPATDTSIGATARVWYTDANLVPTVPDAAAVDEDVIGDSGTTVPPPIGGGGDTGDTGDDGDDDDFFGCSVGHGGSGIDPLLPGMLIAALVYQGLRRRSRRARASR